LRSNVLCTCAADGRSATHSAGRPVATVFRIRVHPPNTQEAQLGNSGTTSNTTDEEQGKSQGAGAESGRVEDLRSFDDERADAQG
jgi:hypothetical protein